MKFMSFQDTNEKINACSNSNYKCDTQITNYNAGNYMNDLTQNTDKTRMLIRFSH